MQALELVSSQQPKHSYKKAEQPHTHNNGLAPRVIEKQYWNAQKPVDKNT
jgi:hypothetical protein